MALTSDEIQQAWAACLRYATAYPGSVSDTSAIRPALVALGDPEASLVSQLLTQLTTIEAGVVGSNPRSAIKTIVGELEFFESSTWIALSERDSIAAVILLLLDLLTTDTASGGYGAASEPSRGWC